MDLPDGAADERAVHRAAAMYAADRASQRLGIAVFDVAAGRAAARMRVSDDMVNGHGSCHGGYLFLLADTAFAFACNSYGPVTVAAAADIVFVAPARSGDELVAQARERVRFGRNGVYDVTVQRSDGTVLAEFRGLGRVVSRGPADQPASQSTTTRSLTGRDWQVNTKPAASSSGSSA